MQWLGLLRRTGGPARRESDPKPTSDGQAFGALLKAASSRPKAEAVCSTIFFTWASLLTLPVIAIAFMTSAVSRSARALDGKVGGWLENVSDEQYGG